MPNEHLKSIEQSVRVFEDKAERFSIYKLIEDVEALKSGMERPVEKERGSTAPDVTDKLEKIVSVIGRQEQELQDLKQKNGEYGRLKAENSQLKQKMQTLFNRLVQNEKELAKSDGEVSALQIEIQALKGRNEKWDAVKAEYKKMADVLNSQVRRIDEHELAIKVLVEKYENIKRKNTAKWEKDTGSSFNAFDNNHLFDAISVDNEVRDLFNELLALLKNKINKEFSKAL